MIAFFNNNPDYDDGWTNSYLVIKTTSTADNCGTSGTADTDWPPRKTFRIPVQWVDPHQKRIEELRKLAQKLEDAELLIATRRADEQRAARERLRRIPFKRPNPSPLTAHEVMIS
jgi:hypothetical protein